MEFVPSMEGFIRRIDELVSMHYSKHAPSPTRGSGGQRIPRKLSELVRIMTLWGQDVAEIDQLKVRI